jgi:hypothetical protein
VLVLVIKAATVLMNSHACSHARLFLDHAFFESSLNDCRRKCMSRLLRQCALYAINNIGNWQPQQLPGQGRLYLLCFYYRDTANWLTEA